MLSEPNPLPSLPDLHLASVEDALDRLHLHYLPALNAILDRVEQDPTHGEFVEEFVSPLNRSAGYLLVDLYDRQSPETYFATVGSNHYPTTGDAFDDLADDIAPGIRAIIQYLEATDLRPITEDGGATYSAVIQWRIHPLWDNVGYMLADRWGFPSHRFSAGGGNKPG